MLDLFTATMAFAAEGDDGGGFGALLGPIPMLVIMGAIFYFLLIRPQQRKAKETKKMLENLRKGDEVVTNGGIYGRITGLNENQVVMEVAPQTRIKVLRTSVTHIVSSASADSSDRQEKNS